MDLDARGNIARDDDYATSVPGVFVAGDAAAASRSSCGPSPRALRGRGRGPFLTGGTELPSPIPPTARPLTV